VQGDESFIEFGSGRGQLTYWIVKSTKSSRYFLVDRESHRHKFDNKLRDELPDADVQRIRADILNLVLEEVPGIKNQSNVSALLVKNFHNFNFKCCIEFNNKCNVLYFYYFTEKLLFLIIFLQSKNMQQKLMVHIP
jgi:phospholipid N-methyltransferase